MIGKIEKEWKLAGLSPERLQKEERKEREQKKALADMDPLVKEINQYREDARQMRKSNQMSSIDTKLKSGEELTPEEIEYLKQNHPEAYRSYQEVKQEKQAYERQLKNCRTKEDVEKLKSNKMGHFMAEAKKTANNPVIPKGKKKELMEKLLRKVMMVEKAHIKFKKSAFYQNLPTEEEITEKVTEKVKKTAEETKPAKNETEETMPAENGTKETKFPESGIEETMPAEFKEVRDTITGYLIIDRPSGYGLEYYEMDDTKENQGSTKSC